MGKFFKHFRAGKIFFLRKTQDSEAIKEKIDKLTT